MKSQHARTWIVAGIAAVLLSGCNQSANTAKDDTTAKSTTAATSAPYNPADASKAPPQFPNQANGGTILHYGTGK